MISGLRCERRECILSFQDCINCARQRQIPQCSIFPEFIQWIAKEEEEKTGISITQLLFCPRRAWLTAKTSYIVNPEDMWAMFRGSMFHGFLEQFKNPDTIIETRFERDLFGIKITGKPDKIDLRTGALYDYKSLSGELSGDRSLRWGHARLHDQVQVNLYRWLVEPQFQIRSLWIVYLAGDCAVQVPVEIREPNTKKYKPIAEAFERAKALSPIWDKNYEEILSNPSIQVPKEEGWICRYCLVRDKCEAFDKR